MLGDYLSTACCLSRSCWVTKAVVQWLCLVITFPQPVACQGHAGSPKLWFSGYAWWLPFHSLLLVKVMLGHQSCGSVAMLGDYLSTACCLSRSCWVTKAVVQWLCLVITFPQPVACQGHAGSPKLWFSGYAWWLPFHSLLLVKVMLGHQSCGSVAMLGDYLSTACCLSRSCWVTKAVVQWLCLVITFPQPVACQGHAGSPKQKSAPSGCCWAASAVPHWHSLHSHGSCTPAHRTQPISIIVLCITFLL